MGPNQSIEITGFANGPDSSRLLANSVTNPAYRENLIAVPIVAKSPGCDDASETPRERVPRQNQERM